MEYPPVCLDARRAWPGLADNWEVRTAVGFYFVAAVPPFVAPVPGFVPFVPIDWNSTGECAHFRRLLRLWST